MQVEFHSNEVALAFLTSSQEILMWQLGFRIGLEDPQCPKKGTVSVFRELALQIPGEKKKEKQDDK